MILSTNASIPFAGTAISSSAFTYSSWIDTEYNENTIQVGCGTLNATSVLYRIEGRYNSTKNRAASLSAGEITTATPDTVLEISPHYPQMRIGLKTNYNATPNNTWVTIVGVEQ